jgi:outer membrane protein assembly factor BamA
MPVRCITLLLLVASAAAAVSAAGQRPASQHWTAPLVGIYFSGSERFSAEELERASGLERAVNVTPADLRLAADRLAATGALREVTYRFEPSGTGVVVRFQVLDAEQWAPVRFENLVWFSDDELMEHLKQRVPLFRGELPPGSELSEQAELVLTMLLAERGITGRVQHSPLGTMDGRITGIAFRVEGVVLRVESFEFPGSTGEFPQLLRQAAQAVRGRDYSAGMVASYAQHSFLPVYLRHGRLKAKFGTPRARLAGREGNAHHVVVALPVEEGREYRLRALEITGNVQFTAAELRGSLQAKLGEPVDAVALDEQMAVLRRLYGTRGYLHARAEAQPDFDDAEGTASYRLQVREGPQFRMGRVRVEGLTGADAERLARSYGQKPDEPFNASYEWKVGQELLPAAWRAQAERARFAMKLEPQPETQTVDVVLSVELR